MKAIGLIFLLSTGVVGQQLKTTIAPTQVNICSFAVDSQGKCDPMVVHAFSHYEEYPADHIVMSGDMVIKGRDVWTCTDKRRVLMATEAGDKLCILFPDAVGKGSKDE